MITQKNIMRIVQKDRTSKGGDKKTWCGAPLPCCRIFFVLAFLMLVHFSCAHIMMLEGGEEKGVVAYLMVKRK